MNKKQAGIIVILLALIVCAGILAARVGGPLNVGNVGFEGGLDALSTSKNADFFVEAKAKRQLEDDKVLAAFKTIIDEKNVAQAQRDEATKKHLEKTTLMNYENTIELNLQAKKFDTVCLITGANAQVIVKGKDLTSAQRKQIQDVVKSVSKTLEAEIQCRQ